MKTSLYRTVVACGLVLAALVTSVGVAAAAELTDLSGRKVRVPDQVRKISIDDGRFLVALSLIQPDPVQWLAAWPRDVHRIGEAKRPETRAARIAKFVAMCARGETVHG